MLSRLVGRLSLMKACVSDLLVRVRVPKNALSDSTLADRHLLSRFCWCLATAIFAFSTGFGSALGGVTVTTMVSLSNTNGAYLGANPYGGLVQAADGNFYGTTHGGGTNGNFGTIFRISTNGVFTSLISFSGNSGVRPGLISFGGCWHAIEPKLYGKTYGGGSRLGHVSSDNQRRVQQPSDFQWHQWQSSLLHIGAGDEWQLVRHDLHWSRNTATLFLSCAQMGSSPRWCPLTMPSVPCLGQACRSGRTAISMAQPRLAAPTPLPPALARFFK